MYLPNLQPVLKMEPSGIAAEEDEKEKEKEVVSSEKDKTRIAENDKVCDIENSVATLASSSEEGEEESVSGAVSVSSGTDSSIGRKDSSGSSKNDRCLPSAKNNIKVATNKKHFGVTEVAQNFFRLLEERQDLEEFRELLGGQ